jgi:hypothetical protein
MPAELRCKIKISLPVDGKNPRNIAFAMATFDAALAALKEKLAGGQVEASDTDIVQTRGQTGAAAEAEPQPTDKLARV